MWDEGLVSGPDRLCAAGAAQEAGTSLRGSDPCAPDPVETKSFVGALRESERERERKGREVEGGGSPVSSRGPGRPARSIASIKP